MRQVLGTGTLGWPRGLGWGGRWEGGSGCGTHVNPLLIHVNVWQKPLQYCKVISLQLIKIIGKKINKEKNLCAISFFFNSYFVIKINLSYCTAFLMPCNICTVLSSHRLKLLICSSLGIAGSARNCLGKMYVPKKAPLYNLRKATTDDIL